MAEVCDAAYVLQVEQIERRALAMLVNAPYAEEPLPTVEDLVEQFHEHLYAEPVRRAGGGTDLDDLVALLTVGGR